MLPMLIINEFKRFFYSFIVFVVFVFNFVLTVEICLFVDMHRGFLDSLLGLLGNLRGLLKTYNFLEIRIPRGFKISFSEEP